MLNNYNIIILLLYQCIHLNNESVCFFHVVSSVHFQLRIWKDFILGVFFADFSSVRHRFIRHVEKASLHLNTDIQYTVFKVALYIIAALILSQLWSNGQSCFLFCWSLSRCVAVRLHTALPEYLHHSPSRVCVCHVQHILPKLEEAELHLPLIKTVQQQQQQQQQPRLSKLGLVFANRCSSCLQS